jgi:predicted acetyltransferase
VPGGSLACSGITVVGVAPTHRRRGVLTAMMRAQLDAAHERGEPLAALWSSEAPIYGRFGYGLASWHGEFELEQDRAQYAAPLERRGSVRFVDADDAKELLPPVWDAVFRERPGMFARTPTWWESRIVDDAEDRRPPGAGPKRFAVLDLDGNAAAYAVYRHHPKWEGGVSVGKIAVSEALATSPQAWAEIWRFVLDIDWAKTVTSMLLPPDHPLFFLLAEPRRLNYRVSDALWMRLVDVGAALSRRTYTARERIVFDVRDAFCPWNEGRWAVDGDGAQRTEDEPDIRLDARELGSVYLGGVTFAQLQQGLRLEEVKPGAIARADALFHHPLHPWCPEIF